MYNYEKQFQSSEQAIDFDPWQDELFLVKTELETSESQSRYEELIRRLNKIMEKE